MTEKKGFKIIELFPNDGDHQDLYASTVIDCLLKPDQCAKPYSGRKRDEEVFKKVEYMRNFVLEDLCSSPYCTVRRSDVRHFLTGMKDKIIPLFATKSWSLKKEIRVLKNPAKDYRFLSHLCEYFIDPGLVEDEVIRPASQLLMMFGNITVNTLASRVKDESLEWLKDKYGGRIRLYDLPTVALD